MENMWKRIEKMMSCDRWPIV